MLPASLLPVASVVAEVQPGAEQDGVYLMRCLVQTSVFCFFAVPVYWAETTTSFRVLESGKQSV
jgi:hypothetical protein